MRGRAAHAPSPAKAHKHTCIRARMASSQRPRHPAASRHSCCRRFPSADGSCASTRLASFCARVAPQADKHKDTNYWETYGERDMHTSLKDRRKQGTLKRQPRWLTHQR